MPSIPLESIKIDGLVPIIIHVAPVVNLPFLLGLADVPETDDTAEFQPQQSPIDAPRRFTFNLDFTFIELNQGKMTLYTNMLTVDTFHCTF